MGVRPHCTSVSGIPAIRNKKIKGVLLSRRPRGQPPLPPCQRPKYYYHHLSDAGTWRPGGPLAPQYLADQLTLLKLERADYHHLLVWAPYVFYLPASLHLSDHSRRLLNISVLSFPKFFASSDLEL